MISFSKLKAWRASGVLTLGIAGLLFGLGDGRSRAQQERQLVQTNSANTVNVRRIALVIGNGAYTSAPALKNPPNDARDMAATLKALGFDVSSGVNVSQREMKRLIREFGQRLKAGGNGLFYYAGHGVQSKGHNYIIPVDAEIQSEADVEDSGVDVGLVLNYMDDAQNGLNIVILDACRNNPFARSFRSASDGLAQVDAPTGTLIAYATAPGRVAADGAGENGLYTSELLKAMRLPGLTATDMFMRVRAEVMKQTGSKQVPWEASSLVGAFYFSAAPSTTAPRAQPSLADTTMVEAEYWETVKNSSLPADYQDYLKEYPQGRYAQLARLKLRQLETSINSGTAENSTAKPASESKPKPTMAYEAQRMGEELAKQKKWPEAEAAFREAMRLRAEGKDSPGSTAADATFTVDGLAKSLLAQGKQTEAEAEWKAHISKAPNDAQRRMYFSWFLMDQNRAEAEAEAREAVRLAPDETLYLQSLVSFLEKQNKLDAVEAEWRTLIKRSHGKPYEAWSHYVLGNFLFFKTSKRAEAEAETKEAIRLAKPTDTNANVYRQQLQMIKDRKY